MIWPNDPFNTVPRSYYPSLIVAGFMLGGAVVTGSIIQAITGCAAGLWCMFLWHGKV